MDNQLQTQILERLTRIEEKQDAAKEAAEKLQHDLFGNGQPGIIASLSGRVSKLEDKALYILGASGAIGIITTAFALWLNWKS